MKKFSVLMGIVVLSLILAGPAPGATYLLDTGPGGYRYYLNSGQWLAGQFTTTQAWNVGAIEGDISTTTAGTVDVAIYTDVSNSPGALVFTEAFQSQPAGYQGWQGTTGSAGTLAAGSYWIAFEVPAGSLFSGNYGGYSVPPSLSHEAFSSDKGFNWNINTLDLAARIEGTPAAVPVPPTVWLLGSGLLGMVGLRRVRKS